MPTNILTPTGRLVQGDFFKPNTTNQAGEPLVTKSGPNKGQPRVEYFGALAFKKGDPLGESLIATMVTQAAMSFASLFPAGGKPTDAAGNWGCSLPKFSWKIIDGDGVDENGKSNASKPGMAGHWVVRFSTGYAPEVHTRAKNLPDNHPERLLDPNPERLVRLQLSDAALCRRGYYFRVSGSVDGNGQTLPSGTPGLYTNYNLVELVAFGEEITSGPIAADVFAQAPGATVAAPVVTPPPAPSGLTPTATWPVGVTHAQLTAAGWTDDAIVGAGYATRPSAPVAVPVVPTPAAPVPPAPTASLSDVVPYEGFLHTLTAKAAGATYDQLIAAGWTDETLRTNGLMV